MNNEGKEKLVLKLFDIWNRGLLDDLEEVISPDFQGHYPHAKMNGIDGVKGMIQFLRGAFPDYQEEIKEMIIGEEKVVVRYACRGTQKGNFIGIAPTGNKVEFEEISIFRIKDGKIAEQWGVFDSLKMMQQLGVVKRV